MTLQSGFGSRPWLIVPVCAAMHLTFAIGYIFDNGVSHITALHSVYVLFGWLMPTVCFVAATTALVPMFFALSPLVVHLCLWPQQFLLFLMAYSAISASWMAQYPDGYKQTAVFIFSDQCLGIYVTIAHLVALARNAQLVTWR